jgi:hypothetical protein
MDARQVVVNFLSDAPRSFQLGFGEQLIEEIAATQRAVLATADDGSPAILVVNGATMQLYRRLDNESFTVQSFGELRGMTMLTHRKVLAGGGALVTGYTIEHPYFPRSGVLYVDAFKLDEEDAEHLPTELGQFLYDESWRPTSARSVQ